MTCTHSVHDLKQQLQGCTQTFTHFKYSYTQATAHDELHYA